MLFPRDPEREKEWDNVSKGQALLELVDVVRDLTVGNNNDSLVDYARRQIKLDKIEYVMRKEDKNG